MDVPSELYQKYLYRRIQDLEACQDYLASGDFSKLEKIGHQLKGKGTTFGHPELSLIGQILEVTASQKSISGIEKALNDYTKWINSIV